VLLWSVVIFGQSMKLACPGKQPGAHRSTAVRQY
jgi:hypothetical protein